MLNDLERAAHRYAVFAEQVLAPAVFPAAQPLQAAVYQCTEIISYDQARCQTYQPVPLGWRWGPRWSTAWFKLTGQIPQSFADRPVALRFSSGTEALLWRDAAPFAGYDENHSAHILHSSAPADEVLELYIEAACNRPHGVTMFRWDEREMRQRWCADDPGRLELCELAVFDPLVWELHQTFDFARRLMLQYQPHDDRGRRLSAALRDALLTVDDHRVPQTAQSALTILRDALQTPAPADASHGAVVGHAHIDTAWLWPIRETRRKCLRTFASALTLIDRFPDFRFMHTQPQQYQWIAEDAPALFERIRDQIKAGRWEAAGAMWVEPDCNIPSGESFIRQIMHARRFWRERLPEAQSPTYLFLPDSFGYSPCLPQIMKLAGLNAFITNKLAWNESNRFPHVNFVWRGLDGSEVLAHCTPGQDYNSQLEPHELRRAARNIAELDSTDARVWLQPFGHGDGGGGPTAESILNVSLADLASDLPSLSFQSLSDFCDALHRRCVAAARTTRPWPVWDGELYLELHRGTLTTVAWLKQANRRAEHALRAAEWLSSTNPAADDADHRRASAEVLDPAWKLLLLNQFHDTLPGTSIAAVYEDARKQMDQTLSLAADVSRRSAERWLPALNTSGLKRPVAVFNPSTWPRSEILQIENQTLFINNVPGLGVKLLDLDQSAPNLTHVEIHDDKLSNGLVSASIDDVGRIISLRLLNPDREACCRDDEGAPVPMNQLVLYDDRPISWEAWDIDREYVEKAFPVNSPADSKRIVEHGPLRASIEIERPLGQHSRLLQRFTLNAGSPRLDVHARVEWREERRLLRVLFPVNVRARYATYDAQFGHIQRPAHRNTPWDRAMFEVCGHRWMDLAEPDFGVALINDSKYGCSCDGRVMGLSLLRSPKFPNPDADMETHEFTYSLMPHAGDWRRAGVDHQADALNNPLITLPADPAQSGQHAAWAPFELRGPAAPGLTVAAMKCADDDESLILRIVETHGRRGDFEIAWRLPVKQALSVDVLERPLNYVTLEHDPAVPTTRVPIAPFQIITLLLRL